MGPRLRYLAGELGTGLKRNTLMLAATIVTVTVSLALLGAALLVQRQVDLARDLFYAQVEVSIFLEDGIPERTLSSLQSDLQESAVVDDVIYESKEDAYEHFKEIFAGDPVMQDSVTPEIMPASFRVKLIDPQQYEVIASQFAGYPGVQEVVDQRQVLERFFSVMEALRNGALVVALLQLGAAVALIFNTIRITAFARREQTGIMKLVGATNWYIRLPFVLEGVVAGVLGATLASVLLYLGLRTLVTGLRQELSFVPFIGLHHFWSVVPILVLIGAGIAAVASFVSLRRFLAV
ncbi:MAG TPA: permease-like cell division protein FtsX [Egibacteraceae bacterium]|jgi:cell division transport system permease protein|nr:permease-like cell division protein FtsX [Egibacteraceae bacterium]